EWHPAAIDEERGGALAQERRQHLVARPAVVRAVVEQELVLAVEVSAHAHVLKQWHLARRLCTQRAQLVGAAGVLRPLLLARYPAVPLPDPESHEERREHERDECEGQ